MAYQLKSLKPKHHRVVDLVLAVRSTLEIAEDMGVTTRSVHYVTACPAFKDELARRRKDLEEAAVATLRSAVKDDAEVHVRCLGDDDPRVAQHSANEILDRVGITKQGAKNGQGSGVGVVITAEHLNVLQIALQECNSDRKGQDVVVEDTETPQ